MNKLITLALAVTALSPVVAHAGNKGELAAVAIEGAIAAGQQIYDRLAAIDRAVVVNVENRTKEALTWEGAYEYSGSVSDYSRTIPAGSTGFVVASKSEGSVGTGAVGLFRYRLGSSPRVFEVFYQVPFDYNLYSNLFNANIVNASVPLDKRRYNVNYNNAYYASKDRPTENSNGYRFHMDMTNKGKAKLNVTIE